MAIGHQKSLLTRRASSFPDCRAGTFRLIIVANQIKHFGRERRAARTTQRAKIGLKRRGAHAFQAVASHGATERAARAPERSHGRNRRAQSHSAVARPRRRAGRAAAAAQEKRLGRLSPRWERLLAWRRATSPMRTQSRAARGMLLGPV